MIGMDHWASSWRQLWLSSSPFWLSVTSTQASDQFKGYSADTCPPSAEVQPNGCTANRPSDRGSRHAGWRRQFNPPDCAQLHEDRLRAICHAPWLLYPYRADLSAGWRCKRNTFRMEMNCPSVGNRTSLGRGVHWQDKVIIRVKCTAS